MKRIRYCFMFMVSLCFFFASMGHAEPSYEVFTESFPNGEWHSWSWTNHPTASSQRSFRGSKSLRMVFANQWDAIAPAVWWDPNGDDNNEGFSTKDYPYLNFAVYNDHNASNLFIFAANENGVAGNVIWLGDYTESGTIPQDQWVWVRVPIEDFGLGVSPALSYFAVESSQANGLAHFDDIHFGASPYFLKGIYAGGDIYIAPGVVMWHWGASISYPSSGNDYWVKINPNTTWAGIELHLVHGSVSSSDFGSVTLLFKPSINNQGVNVSFVGPSGATIGTVTVNGDYIPNTLEPVQSGTWYRVNIPISDFQLGGSADIASVTVETIQDAVLEVDDVRLVQKMEWPMDNIPMNTLGGFHFGDHWISSCGGYAKLHTGVDYSDRADSNRPVYATARGVVKPHEDQGGWGWAVTIQHENELTTSYLHLNYPAVSEDEVVERGEYLGTTMYLEDNQGIPVSHLHFNLRLMEFDDNSQVGALPPFDCGGYPSFPSSFLDTKDMDWEDIP